MGIPVVLARKSHHATRHAIIVLLCISVLGLTFFGARGLTAHAAHHLAATTAISHIGVDEHAAAAASEQSEYAVVSAPLTDPCLLGLLCLGLLLVAWIVALLCRAAARTIGRLARPPTTNNSGITHRRRPTGPQVTFGGPLRI